MLNKNPKMLLYIALADAYAAGTEFVKINSEEGKRTVKKALEFTEYIRHPLHVEPGKGFYTDDAEMSVANARVLLENKFPFTPPMFADAYLREFKRGGKRKGYAAGFYKFLLSIKNGEDFLDKIRSDSDKNGAAMRSVPIGVLPKIDDVLNVSAIQAGITHNTEAGIFSAQLVSLMSHFALYYDDDLKEIGNFCWDHLDQNSKKKYSAIFRYLWSGAPVKKISSNMPISITTVHAVLSLLKTEETLMDIMKRLITWGGDTDSVAAIAWGVFSSRNQNEDLPEFMIEELENGSTRTGAPYLLDIGTKLMNKYSKKII